MKKPDLKQDEEYEMEISSAVRRTKGIIKIDPERGKEIAESDELSSLEN